MQYTCTRTHTHAYLKLVGLFDDHFYLCMFTQTGTAHLGHLLLLCSHQGLVLIGVT